MLKLPKKLSGRKVKCPACQAAFVVPGGNSAASSAAGPSGAAKRSSAANPSGAAKPAKPASPQAPLAPAPQNPSTSPQPAALTPGDADFSADPFGASADPFGASADPFGASADPLATGADPFGASADPLASGADPFGASSDPFGASAGPSHPHLSMAHAASPMAAPGMGSPHFAAGPVAGVGQSPSNLPSAAPASKPQSAATPSKADQQFNHALVYRMPSVLGIGCASLNLVIVLLSTALACVGLFPRFKAVGLVLFLGGSQLGAQIYAINGFIGVLRMVDRHGGIQASRAILACPFITAIILFFGIGFFGIYLAAFMWVFMLAYTWPVGWWLWLKLEKKEAATDFGEADFYEDSVKLLTESKKGAAQDAAQPAWRPVGVPLVTEEPEAKPKGMSPETKLRLLLGGGAVAAVMLVGGIVLAAVMLLGNSAGGGGGIAESDVPDGWYAASACGVHAIFPGEPTRLGDGDMEGWTAESERTNAFFFLAATKAGTKQSVEGFAKNVGRKLNGDVLGAREFTRGPMTGMQGQLKTSARFPDMTVEAYQHEGRSIILGYSRDGGARMLDFDSDGPQVSGEELEAERDAFFDSLTFSAGGLFGY